MPNKIQEGGVKAPIRYPIDWGSSSFYDASLLEKELTRVFDICHGCRRCVSLCEAFPTLFDLVDNAPSFEIDTVDKKDYSKVVEQCYLCDLCFQTKCPYVPPHEWEVDFPHLMLRAKAVKFREQGSSKRDKLLTSTNALVSMNRIPLLDITSNWLINQKPARNLMEKLLGISAEAKLPSFKYISNAMFSKEELIQNPKSQKSLNIKSQVAGRTTGKVAFFLGCYGKFSQPDIYIDAIKVFRHNDIQVTIINEHDVCCGMPKLELGDLESVELYKKKNLTVLKEFIDRGFDIVSLTPSCVLMFKQELPLLFPEDKDLLNVSERFFDPFEYLSYRYKKGLLKCDFRKSIGKIFYHSACHQRVQNIGAKTYEILKLIPNTELVVANRCSGHDGTYALKKETYDKSVKIVKPILKQVHESKVNLIASDCSMASMHIAHNSSRSNNKDYQSVHPISLLCSAYKL